MIRQTSTKTVYKNPWMTVREDKVEFPNGHKGIYGVVEKDHFALIIPFDGTHFHLVEQYRYPTGEQSIEFPQGKHEDNPTINPIDLANAELEEEIGLVANEMNEIGFLFEAPGYSNQGFHIFFATDLSEGQKKPDVTETDLVHHKMTIEEFEQAVLSGKITDAPTISAYGLWKIKMSNSEIKAQKNSLQTLSQELESVSKLYSKKFKINRTNDWFILKLQEEMGELIQSYLMMSGNARKKGQSKQELLSSFKSELSDVFAHVLLIANLFKIDLNEEVKLKWLKWKKK